MTSPFGLDLSQMQAVVNQTNEAIAQMTRLNGVVESRAGDIMAHAQSDAGRILMGRLNTWNNDFGAIVSALVDLNGQVQQWMQTSANTGGSAAGAAGGSHAYLSTNPGTPPMAPQAPFGSPQAGQVGVHDAAASTVGATTPATRPTILATAPHYAPAAAPMAPQAPFGSPPPAGQVGVLDVAADTVGTVIAGN